MEILVRLVFLVTFNVSFDLFLVSIGFTKQTHDISLKRLDLLSGTLILVHPCDGSGFTKLWIYWFFWFFWLPSTFLLVFLWFLSVLPSEIMICPANYGI